QPCVDREEIAIGPRQGRAEGLRLTIRAALCLPRCGQTVRRKGPLSGADRRFFALMHKTQIWYGVVLIPRGKANEAAGCPEAFRRRCGCLATRRAGAAAAQGATG